MCLEAQTFTFLFLADKTMLLELRLLNGRRETDAFGCDLNCTGILSEPKSHFTKKDRGREKRN